MQAITTILNFFNLPQSQSTTVQIGLIIFIALFINLFLLWVLNYFYKHVKKTHNPFDDIFLDCLRKPLAWLVWIIAISFALDITPLDANLKQYAPTIRSVGAIITITWFFIRLVKQSEPIFFERADSDGNKLDQSTVLAISRLLKITILIIAGLMVLQNLGLSISAVLAFGGVGGIAVGFAAKDLLANFFGGLMIFLDRPFGIGDWIRSPDREIEGTVERINWRLCMIRTFDKRPLYIPNAIFNNIAIENPSRMSHRRIKETIGVRYDDATKLKNIIDQTEKMLKTHPQIDAKQTLMVNFNEFAPSSLDFFIYTFTKTVNWQKYHQVKQDVLLKIIDIIENNGAEVAFPTRTLHLKSNPDAKKHSDKT